MKKIIGIIIIVVFAFASCKKDNNVQPNNNNKKIVNKTITEADLPKVPNEVKGFLNFANGGSVTFANNVKITYASNASSLTYATNNSNIQFVNGGLISQNFTTVNGEMGYSCGNAMMFEYELEDENGNEYKVKFPASADGVNPKIIGKYTESENSNHFFTLNTNGTGSLKSHLFEYISCINNNNELDFKWGSLLGPNCSPLVINLQFEITTEENPDATGTLIDINLYLIFAQPNNCSDEIMLFFIAENVNTKQIISLFPLNYIKN